MNEQVKIVEVGPRDGLQNEARILPAQLRIEFIEKLIGAGLTTVEVGSFVSPKWVPQMANTKVVLEALGNRAGINFPVLVPNKLGLDAAIDAGAKEIAIFISASETFSQKNINCSIAASIERMQPVAEYALAAGLRVRGYVSCALGCPYEGDVPLTSVVRSVETLATLGCYELSIGDTIGVGTPRKVQNLIRAISRIVPINQIAAHFHDTYGQALANLYAALEEGVRIVDASTGGLGGCPYAKGSSGNVATESVVYMMNGMGIHTGVGLDRLLDVVHFINNALELPSKSSVYQAMRGCLQSGPM